MFDFAVIIPTVLRPDLLRASRSVIEQTVDGTINLVIGVDFPLGDPAVLDAVRKLETRKRRVTIVDPGYSTATSRGGFFPNRHGGSLRTALSFLANARHLAYLDDDNWHAPHHIESLASALKDKAWAFSLRYYCDSRTGGPLAIDLIESVGPGKGMHAARYGGFCNTSTLMLDTQATLDALHHWSRGVALDGRGPDRSIFDALRALPYGETNQATAFYWMQHSDINHATRLNWLRSVGAIPSLPMPFEEALKKLPGRAALNAPAGDVPKAKGPAILSDLLRQAKAERIIVVGEPDPSLIHAMFETLAAIGITPHLLQIDTSDAETGPQRRAAFLSALAASPYRERLVLSDASVADVTAFLREQEVLADFIYVIPTNVESLGDLLTGLWVIVKRNGVLLGANYDAAGHPALAPAADEFAYRRAAALVRCGGAAAQHFLIQRV